MAHIEQTILLNVFYWIKNLLSYLDLNGVYCWWFNLQDAIIGSGNGLAPNRRQAIIWTHDDLVHWRINAPLSLNGLVKIAIWIVTAIWH